MNKAELTFKIELFRRELGDLESIKVACTSCTYCQRHGWCSKYGAQPPADVQGAGCEDWLWDRIPF